MLTSALILYFDFCCWSTRGVRTCVRTRTKKSNHCKECSLKLRALHGGKKGDSHPFKLFCDPILLCLDETRLNIGLIKALSGAERAKRPAEIAGKEFGLKCMTKNAKGKVKLRRCALHIITMLH